MDKYVEINRILIEWNPLSVIGPAVSDEYIGLIPSILAQISEPDLANYLEKTLSIRYGLEYEDNDMKSIEEFQSVLKQMANILWSH